jgi:hypothetical protein
MYRKNPCHNEIPMPLPYGYVKTPLLQWNRKMPLLKWNRKAPLQQICKTPHRTILLLRKLNAPSLGILNQQL